MQSLHIYAVHKEPLMWVADFTSIIKCVISGPHIKQPCRPHFLSSCAQDKKLEVWLAIAPPPNTHTHTQHCDHISLLPFLIK
jgi:hypothetical protein